MTGRPPRRKDTGAVDRKQGLFTFSLIPDIPEEWLDGFNTFSIYQMLPQIIELWGLTYRRMCRLKKLRPTDREMTTPLFLLWCVQLGLSVWDLDLLTIGMVNDMYMEAGTMSISMLW